ncbi:hypothetical protein DdX_10474 [Ditylenchus destructor]|uniref:Uncharacterized protein n=1 Tax=Ditylenchus destructor TaxID=166010 RepID=A0AAD4N2L8_9BILA|nr:hypothetical protein DdX_10474 [Ditylenchus destructor]
MFVERSKRLVVCLVLLSCASLLSNAQADALVCPRILPQPLLLTRPPPLTCVSLPANSKATTPECIVTASRKYQPIQQKLRIINSIPTRTGADPYQVLSML